LSSTASVTITITNRLGLHARPAMMFVEAASRFEADVAVRRLDQDAGVDGKSIMQMMMLAATQGTQIEISATGADAGDAVESLGALVESNFQEE
jgi:phosphocarrier protein